MRTGVQLYSLREYIEENGLEKALEIISAAGFEGVEFAGFYQKSADEINTLLKKYNLKAISAHVGVDAMDEQLPLLKGLGMNSVVIPWAQLDDEEQFSQFSEKLPALMEKLSGEGLVLGYHNHAHEFKDGRDRIAELCEKVPSLKLEPDVFWLAVAGVDAEKFLTENRERLLYLHIKELGKDYTDVNPVVGSGNASIAKALELGKEFGVEWAILEVERIDMPWADYLKKSNEFMKKYR